MKKILLLAAVAAFAATTAAVRADSIVYNQNVAADGSGHLFYGTGNANGDFTTSTNGGAVLGLRGDIRFVGPTAGVDDGSGHDDLYLASAGGGSTALWNLTYSIDVSGAADTNLADYTAIVSITGPNGALNSFDALLIPDNDGPHNVGELANGVAQNSENIGFSFIGGNPNTPGLYTIGLTLANSGGTVVSDQIFVNAAPLPSAATMGLGMLALLGAAGMIRSKLRSA